MDIYKADTIVYSVNVSDLNFVAHQEIGRELTTGEIQRLERVLGENIPWYEAISSAIDQHVPSSNKLVKFNSEGK